MKIFIKLGILLAILLSSVLGFADSKANKVYDTFEGKKGVFMLSFSKDVLEPLQVFLDDDTKKVMYKMKKIKFMAYNENRGGLYASDVFERVNNDLGGAGYFSIDPDDIDCDDCDFEVGYDEDLKLIGHGNKKNMDEFHMVIYDGGDCILFSFFGDITVEDLKECGNFSNSARGFVSF